MPKKVIWFFFLLAIIAGSGYFFLSPKPKKTDLPFISPEYAVSSRSKPTWSPPALSYSHANIENSAKSVLLIDFDKEQIVYEKNPRGKLAIASLTKIMTSLLALELLGPNNTLAVSPEATSCGEASMNLLAGEHCSVRELVYGMILNSGNDAAEVVAQTSTQQGRKQFVDFMNKKAAILGLEDTYFINPSGLDETNKETNLSSAYDLATLFYYNYKNLPLFAEIFTTQEYLAEGQGHRRLYLYNTGWKFSGNYPYLIGAKSGNTDQAGFCFLGLSEKNNRQILLIILGEPDFNTIKKDAWKLFDYGFTTLGL